MVDGQFRTPRRGMDPEALEALMAFGYASLAYHDVLDTVRHVQPTCDRAIALLDELDRAHSELGDLLGHGPAEAVCGLALSVLVLADATVAAVE
ncbi:MAG: hypothetical protein ACYDD4_01750 [Acidimicrobiales bacterium]